MNELRKYQALMLAQQKLYDTVQCQLNKLKENAIMYLDESDDRLAVVIKKGDFFMRQNNYVLSITKDWIISVLEDDIRDLDPDEKILAIRAFMRKHFPSQTTNREIVSCTLRHPTANYYSGDHIVCFYDYGDSEEWGSSLRFAKYEIIELPTDICLDIIIRAMHKFNLPVRNDA